MTEPTEAAPEPIKEAPSGIEVPFRPTFPNLDPRYKPATEDSGIIIRWIGSTARIAEVRYLGIVDPFQLTSLADWLIEKAHKMIAIAEAMEAAKAEAEAQEAAAAEASRPRIAIPKPGLVLDSSMGRPDDQGFRRDR